MSVFSFYGYSEFSEWCEANGYDDDTQHDLESEPQKRNTYDSFYIKKLDSELYAGVSVETSFDNGWGYGDITREGLTRKVEQILIEKVTYV